MNHIKRVTLGRDGMGSDADEADFDAWTAYVCEHIDEASGLDVDVEIRGVRDVQDNRIEAGEAERQRIDEAIQSLWEAFCEDPTLWPSRAAVRP